ncbi:MAG: LacI family transcriptional regulator [Propionibacteriaceae bacterium]|jgi:LacI family transcriptional regulator|nr:LacI family transcriptional regulator [Propionibacteriaceae bacterium]
MNKSEQLSDQHAGRSPHENVVKAESDGINLRTIAKTVGVHVSTVSRVLRAGPESAQSETAVRVLEVADRLGYRPNRVAAGLRTSSTQSIGVVSPRLHDVMVSILCHSIEATSRYSGYQMLLSTPPDDMGEQFRSVEFLLSHRVDGLILTSLHRDESVFVDRLRELPIPVLAANRHQGDLLPSVICDDREGGRLATEYLINLGHTRIGIIAGSRHASTGFDRLLGYRDALNAAGIEIDEALITHTDFEAEGGVIGAHSLLSLAQPPTAIFAVNDMAAIGVLGAAQQRGLRVPDELSVIGYNDIPVVAHLPIPLTTVHSPLSQMGEHAVIHLLKAIRGERPISEVLPVSLVVRASTAPPK